LCIFSLIFSIQSSFGEYFIDFKEQASSIKSIALSGKYLSVIYLHANFTASSTASFVITKL
jgi:hypothetical protein